MPEEKVETTEGKKMIIETYDHDLVNSMDTTDASVVQDLLSESQRRITEEKLQKKESSEKKFLKFFGILFLLISTSVIGYSIWHYMKLTVPIITTPSIGVFPQTESVVAADTDIVSLLAILTKRQDFKIDQPYLVPLIAKNSGNTLISNQDLLEFLQTNSNEPFKSVFLVLRFGIVNTKEGVYPFVIGYVKDPIVANKEFLLNEPKMTSIFEKSLNIALADQNNIIGGGFTQNILYNLNFRILKSNKEDPQKITMLYGYISPNTVVFATKSEIIKDVYEALITQQSN